MTDGDERVLDLIRTRRVVKAADLRFWIGRDPVAAIQRLEESEAIEKVGPDFPAQHWRAIDWKRAL